MEHKLVKNSKWCGTDWLVGHMNLESMTELQRCQPKKIEIQEIANFTF